MISQFKTEYVSPELDSIKSIVPSDLPENISVNKTNLEKLFNEFTLASEIEIFKNFEWKDGEIPEVKLGEDGFFYERDGSIILFRSGLTGNVPLEETKIDNLFNSSLDANAFTRWKRSTLGQGLYTGNSPYAYPIAEGNPDRHIYIMSVNLSPEEVFDCTKIDFSSEPVETYTRKLAVLALESRIFLHPPESGFQYLYGDSSAIKLHTELPYQLFYGDKLKAKIGEEEEIPARWMLLRGKRIQDAKILGKSK